MNIPPMSTFGRLSSQIHTAVASSSFYVVFSPFVISLPSVAFFFPRLFVIFTLSPFSTFVCPLPLRLLSEESPDPALKMIIASSNATIVGRFPMLQEWGSTLPHLVKLKSIAPTLETL